MSLDDEVLEPRPIRMAHQAHSISSTSLHRLRGLLINISLGGVTTPTRDLLCARMQRARYLTGPSVRSRSSRKHIVEMLALDRYTRLSESV
jgi:hypothetical protein